MKEDRRIACESCREQRIKCDREPLGCSRCKSKGKACTYRPDKRKRTQRQEIYKEVEQLKQKLDSFQDGVNEHDTTIFQDSDNILDNLSTTAAAITAGVGVDIALEPAMPWLANAPIDSRMLQSWLDFDILDTGDSMGLSPMDPRLFQFESKLTAAPTFTSSQQSYDEKLIFDALPSRENCMNLMQILETRTKTSSFTNSNNYVDLQGCKSTIESLLQRRESSSPFISQYTTTSPTSISEIFRALASLACADIKRPLRSVKNVQTDTDERGLYEVGTSPSPLRERERHERSLLVKASLMCMNAARASNHDLDLARLQGHRMLTLVLSSWGELAEASNVVWLGFRYATSIGLHRSTSLLPDQLAPKLLDVFWQLFIYTSIFQVLRGRELPVDIHTISVNLPTVAENSGVHSRIQAQMMASIIADKYYRDVSGLLLPSEKNTFLPKPLLSISSDDQSLFDRTNLELDQTEMELNDTIAKFGSTPSILTLQGNVQSMLFFFRYIRLLSNYPFSLQLPQAKRRVEEMAKSIILSIWTLSKKMTETSHRPAIIAGVCLRTMIFIAKFQADSPPHEVEQWAAHLSLGLDALEKLCSHLESSSVLNVAQKLLAGSL